MIQIFQTENEVSEYLRAGNLALKFVQNTKQIVRISEQAHESVNCNCSYVHQLKLMKISF